MAATDRYATIEEVLEEMELIWKYKISMIHGGGGSIKLDNIFLKSQVGNRSNSLPFP
jgi:hypothetical protein